MFQNHKEITLKTLQKHYCFTFRRAATELNISRNALKQLQEKYNIEVWPYKKVKALNKIISDLHKRLDKLETSKNPRNFKSRIQNVKKEIIENQDKLNAIMQNPSIELKTLGVVTGHNNTLSNHIKIKVEDKEISINELTLNTLQNYYHMNQKTVTKTLGINPWTLHALCKKFDICWPSKKINLINNILSKLNDHKKKASSDNQTCLINKKIEEYENKLKLVINNTKFNYNDIMAPEDYVLIGYKKQASKTSNDHDNWITIEMLQKYYHLEIKNAATLLNVDIATMRKICKKFNIRTWPSTKINTIKKIISQLTENIKKINNVQALKFIEEQIERCNGKIEQIIKNPNYTLSEDDTLKPYFDSILKKRRHALISENDNLTIEKLQTCYHLPFESAAKNLGVTCEILELLCHKFEIAQWPKTNSLSENDIDEVNNIDRKDNTIITDNLGFNIYGTSELEKKILKKITCIHEIIVNLDKQHSITSNKTMMEEIKRYKDELEEIIKEYEINDLDAEFIRNTMLFLGNTELNEVKPTMFDNDWVQNKIVKYSGNDYYSEDSYLDYEDNVFFELDSLQDCFTDQFFMEF